MGKTIIAIDDISCCHIVSIRSSPNSMIPPRCTFTIRNYLAWWYDIENLPAIVTFTIFNCYALAKMICTLARRSKEHCELVFIVSIERKVFIAALPLSDRFRDRNALIGLKGNNPKAQKLFWLHYLNRTPHHGFESWPSMNSFKRCMFEQFDLHLAQKTIGVTLTEIHQRGDLCTLHFYWCLHSVLLPIYRIKPDMELLASHCDLLRFVAGLFLLLNTVAARVGHDI